MEIYYWNLFFEDNFEVCEDYEKVGNPYPQLPLELFTKVYVAVFPMTPITSVLRKTIILCIKLHALSGYIIHMSAVCMCEFMFIWKCDVIVSGWANRENLF